MKAIEIHASRQSAQFTLRLGDSRVILDEYPDKHFDSVVCDPPYDLTAKKRGGTGAVSRNPNHPGGRSMIGTGNRDTGTGTGGFMGKDWDATGIAFDPAFWAKVLRVLKPGGHVLAFGGTRTYHRMVCALEDAGFEVRDCLMWCLRNRPSPLLLV